MERVGTPGRLTDLESEGKATLRNIIEQDNFF